MHQALENKCLLEEKQLEEKQFQEQQQIKKQFPEKIQQQLNQQFFNLNQCNLKANFNSQIANVKKWEYFQQYRQFFQQHHTFLKLYIKLNKINQQGLTQNQNCFNFSRQQIQLSCLNDQNQQNRLNQQQNLLDQSSKNISQSYLLSLPSIKYNFQKKYIIQKFKIKNQKVFKQKQTLQNDGIKIRIIDYMQTYQVLQIYCQLGQYAKKYTVLNLSSSSYRHSLKVHGSGGMGTIYLDRLGENNQGVIKCLEFNEDEELSIALKNSIKQFFIADLFSQLQLGPKILRKSGFDFMIFENCLQFQMERCQSFRLENFQQQLKLNLLKLHLLNFVHNDIKPINIMYSPSFQKNIFIDFGLSEYLEEMLGQKSFTKFKGTYQYCSEDMQLIIGNQIPQQIDLYKNDIIMMKKTIQSISLSKKSQPIIENKKLIKYKEQQIVQSDSFDQYMNMFKNQNQIQIENNYQHCSILNQIKYYLYSFKIKPKQGLSLQLKNSFIKLFCLSNEEIIEACIIQIFKFAQILKIQLMASIIQEMNTPSSFNQLNNLKIICQNIETFIKNQKSSLKQKRFYKINQKFNQFNQFNKKNKINLQLNNSQLNIKKQQIRLIKFYQKTQKISRQNLQFVLLKKGQSQKLKRETYFQLFLQYQSFWESNHKQISILNKLKVASIFKQIMTSQEIKFKFQYSRQIYQPDQNFIKDQFHDLIWAYGYLLSYCTDGCLTEWKAMHIMLIVKQTILLNFKYFLYLNKVFLTFIEFLIRNKTPQFFSIILREHSELHWLANFHFSVVNISDQKIKSQLSQIQQLNLNFLRKYQLKELKQSIKQIDCQSQQQRLMYIKAEFAIYQNQPYLQMVLQAQIIVQYLEEEFIMYKGQYIQKYQYFEHIFLLLYANDYLQIFISKVKFFKNIQFKTQLAKVFNNINLNKNFHPLMQNTVLQMSREQHAYNLIESFNKINKIDEKINCFQISKYLFLDIRLKLSTMKKDKAMVSHFINIFIKKQTILSLNYYIWSKFKLYQLELIKNQMLEQSNLYLKLFQKIVKFNVINFKNDLTLNRKLSKGLRCQKIIQCFLQQINKLISHQFIEKTKLFIRNELNQLIQIKINEISNIITHFKQFQQEFYVIYELYEFKLHYLDDKFSIKYFQTKKSLFQFFNVLAKAHPKNYLHNNQIVYKRQLGFSIYTLFFQNQKQNLYRENLLEKGWFNQKLRLFVYDQKLLTLKSQSVYFTSGFLFYKFDAYFMEKPQIIFQIYLIACWKLYILRSQILLKNLNRQFKQQFHSKKLDIQFFFTQFQNNAQKIKGKYSLLPFFIIIIHMISFTSFLQKKFSLWRKYLVLACQLYQKYPKCLNQSKDFKNTQVEQILLRSIIYLEKYNKKRKFNILLRQWIKNVQAQSTYQRSESLMYLNRFRANYNNNREKSFHFYKIGEKSQRILQNSINFDEPDKKQNIDMKFKEISKKSQYTMQQHYITQRILVKVEKDFKKKYKIINIEPFLKDNCPCLIQYKELQDLQKEIELIQLDIHFYNKQYSQSTQNTCLRQTNNTKNNNYKWKKKSNQLKNLKQILETLSYKMDKFVQQIKASRQYKICEQIEQIQNRVLYRQKKRYIKELRLKNHEISNEPLNYYGCFQINLHE